MIMRFTVPASVGAAIVFGASPAYADFDTIAAVIVGIAAFLTALVGG